MGDYIKFAIKVDDKQVLIKDAINAQMLKTNNKDKNLYRDDVLFVMPAINQFLAFLDGIEKLYIEKNFISCAALMRGAVDSVISMMYCLTVDETDRDRFCEAFSVKGRMTKLNKKGEIVRVTGKDMTKKFDQLTGLNISNTYQQLSKILHFGSLQMQMVFRPEGLDGDHFNGQIYGEKTVEPEKFYTEVVEIIDILSTVIIDVLKRNESNNQRDNYKEGV